MYNPIYNKLSLKYGRGNVVIAAGWSPLSPLASKFCLEDYAVIGNLFSTNLGISYLLANLLANPKYNKLAVLSMTVNDRQSKSCEVLRDLFLNGFSLNSSGHCVINSNCFVNKKLITLHPSIEPAYLNLLIEDIELLFIDDYKDLHRIKDFNSMVTTKEKGRKFFMLDITQEVASNKKKIQLDNICVCGLNKSFEQVYLKLLQRVLAYGKDSSNTTYINSLSLSVNNTCEEIKETLVKLNFEEEYLDRYLKHYLKYEDVGCVAGSYSYQNRLYKLFGNQLEKALDKVAKQESRKAYISLWDSVRDLDPDSETVPCLTSLQFDLDASHNLNLLANFRSSEIFRALPCNILGLRTLQAEAVKNYNQRNSKVVSMGNLYLNLNNAHIYNFNLEEAKSSISLNAKLILKTNYDDPTGLYLISVVDENKIQVDWNTYAGDLLARYQSTAKKSTVNGIIQSIQLDNPEIQANHLVYLVQELNSAQEAIQQKSSYHQL